MEILYEDRDIIVVNKEAGLPVQAGRPSEKDLISVLKNKLAQEHPVSEKRPDAGQMSRTQQKKMEPYLGIVHRLDQPVEGLVVFAKNPQAASVLSRQVRAKSESSGRTGSQRAYSDMRKSYQAIVLVSDETSSRLAEYARDHVVTLRDALVRRYSDNTTVIVPEGTKGGKEAELTFRTLMIWEEPEAEGKQTDRPEEKNKKKALLEIHLHTGRHHQIRVQMAHAGLPLDGDRKYGPAGMNYSYNIRLCACELHFRHPATGKKMKFEIVPSFVEDGKIPGAAGLFASSN